MSGSFLIKFSALSAPTKIEELTARSDEKTHPGFDSRWGYAVFFRLIRLPVLLSLLPAEREENLIVQNVAIAIISTTDRSFFSQKRPVKPFFGTIPLLSITFCIFHASPTVWHYLSSFFAKFEDYEKCPLGAIFPIIWPLSLRVPAEENWIKAFAWYSYQVLYL